MLIRFDKQPLQLFNFVVGFLECNLLGEQLGVDRVHFLQTTLAFFQQSSVFGLELCGSPN